MVAVDVSSIFQEANFNCSAGLSVSQPAATVQIHGSSGGVTIVLGAGAVPGHFLSSYSIYFGYCAFVAIGDPYE